MKILKNKVNKIKAKLIVEVEGEFYDNESSEETLRYCVEQDLEDAGFNVIDKGGLHPFTGEKGIVNIKAGEDFYRNYKEFLTIGYAFYDTGEVRIPVTNEIYNTILDYVSGDKDLSLVVDEDSQTAYFGFKSVMKNFSITKDDKIPDNEINLEI